MARLIHLNGAPGVGKSTIAERYIAEHAGVLNCDVDRLRSFIGGWQEDFGAIGAIIRPVALAMIRAHLDRGHDVVLPQMLASEDERARFRVVAVESGHTYAHILLRGGPGQAGARFYGRSASDPLHAVVRGVVDRDGGVAVIADWERRLMEAAGSAQDAIRVDATGDIDCTYEAVVAAIGTLTPAD